MAMAILTRSFAFSSCFSGLVHVDPGTLISDVGHLKEITVEACLSRIVSWKRGSWVRGVHEATKIRFKWCSSIIFLIVS